MYILQSLVIIKIIISLVHSLKHFMKFILLVKLNYISTTTAQFSSAKYQISYS